MTQYDSFGTAECGKVARTGTSLLLTSDVNTLASWAASSTPEPHSSSSFERLWLACQSGRMLPFMDVPISPLVLSVYARPSAGWVVRRNGVFACRNERRNDYSRLKGGSGWGNTEQRMTLAV